MAELIEDLGEMESKCGCCGQTSKIRSFILRDSRPHKIVTVSVCNACNHSETSQSDYEVLDYGVRIACDFAGSSGAPQAVGGEHDILNENLCRMAFINSDAKVTLMQGNRVLFDFTCDSANIDCIQGLIMRGEEIFGMARNAEDEEMLEGIRKKITAILNGSGFKLVIEDKSGFSRVCPLGLEYVDIQDKPVEALGEDNVVYEKAEKSSFL